MENNTDFIEYISPKIAAKKLKIAVTTLRKYSSLIEKTSGNTTYFERDSNNSRLYTKMDISLLKRVISLKSRPGLSLENAVNKALAENSMANVLIGDTLEESDTSKNFQLNKDDKLMQYELLITQLIESNIVLTERLKVAVEKLEAYDENHIKVNEKRIKKSILHRMLGK